MFGLDPETLFNIRQAIAKVETINKVLLYGSRAKGNYRNGSDIDITLLGENLTLENSVYRLMDEIEELYLPYSFDISIFEHIGNTNLKKHIERVGVVFYQRETMKQGWEIKTLGEISEIVNGGTPDTTVPKYWDGENLWITPKDMGKLTNIYVNDTSRKITDEGLKNSSAKILPPNSIILSSRAPIGYLAINAKPISTNQGCKGLVPKQGVDTLYLYYFLSKSVELLNSLGTGATFKELSSSKLGTVEVPLPILAEQQRIVAILDKVFAAIAKAKAHAEQNLKNAKELFESYLQGIFENKGEGWEEKTLGEVAKHSLGKMLDKNKNKGILQKYLRNQNVRWFEFDLSDLTEMPFLESEKEKYTAIKGDVLICEGGYPGRAAIWKENDPVYFQKAIHRVRFNKKEYNEWLLYYLFILDRMDKLKTHFTGTGIQHFTGQALDKLIIPIPPPSKVTSIVQKLDALRAETKKLEVIYQKKINDLEELKKSILQKAFRGEL
jgi:type I restriction enzyme, S subunit